MAEDKTIKDIEGANQSVALSAKQEANSSVFLQQYLGIFQKFQILTFLIS